MHVAVVFPDTKVEFDGIGDHSKRLARELVALGHAVTFVGRGASESPVAGARYVDGWPSGAVRDLAGVVRAIEEIRPDIVLLQYQPFAYGRRGFSPALPWLGRRIGRVCPGASFVVFMHETYVGHTSPATAVMAAYQAVQVKLLARSADLVLVNCALGMRRLRHHSRRIESVPVPSNIDRVSASRRTARLELGLDARARIMVLFGRVDATRVRLLRATLLRASGMDGTELVYIGKDRANVAALVDPLPLPAHLYIGADDRTVSLAMTAADLALAPFADGATGRRGSLAAHLEHGVTTLSTVAAGTDDFLKDIALSGGLCLVAPDADEVADAAETLLGDPQRRARGEESLAALAGELPSWRRTAEAVLHARPGGTEEGARPRASRRVAGVRSSGEG
ncbi:glycosyltransferase [Demequina mangrovi]|uniref:Glycosyltransferase involved in cell wall bisynthesis n=1 Tax=Demequina mangrovi TaxID=1043493 RepID=A0A1H6YMA3_9MICO|nr:glycosyltransferase [Demequina mangrovi]SEJ41516.1 Glycosyltransferase involved in cell wall bisynthesis [Demequina mangrovi]